MVLDWNDIEAVKTESEPHPRHEFGTMQSSMKHLLLAWKPGASTIYEGVHF